MCASCRGHGPWRCGAREQRVKSCKEQIALRAMRFDLLQAGLPANDTGVLRMCTWPDFLNSRCFQMRSLGMDHSRSWQAPMMGLNAQASQQRPPLEPQRVAVPRQLPHASFRAEGSMESRPSHHRTQDLSSTHRPPAPADASAAMARRACLARGWAAWACGPSTALAMLPKASRPCTRPSMPASTSSTPATSTAAVTTKC